MPRLLFHTQWERADDDRSTTRILLNVQRCPNHICAIVHRTYPHAFLVLKPLRESQPIILDTEEKFVPAVRKTNINSPGLTMFDGIGHRLLSDSIEVGCDINVAINTSSSTLK